MRASYLELGFQLANFGILGGWLLETFYGGGQRLLVDFRVPEVRQFGESSIQKYVLFLKLKEMLANLLNRTATSQLTNDCTRKFL